MSAIGTKRTSLVAPHMSAFEPKRTSADWSSLFKDIGIRHYNTLFSIRGAYAAEAIYRICRERCGGVTRRCLCTTLSRPSACWSANAAVISGFEPEHCRNAGGVKGRRICRGPKRLVGNPLCRWGNCTPCSPCSRTVALNPDVIFAGSAPALVATHNATKTIPVVMNTFVDPIALGVVKNLAKPGGNVTGIFTAGGTDALTGKRLSLLKQVVPNLSRVGVMIASGDATDAIMLRLLPAATSALGLTYRVFEVGSSTKLDSAFTEAASDGLQGLFISQNPYFFSRRVEVAALAARARLPAIYSFREHVEAGGLMSYGSSLTEAYRQAARLMAKVLKGANPAEIPVEQADRFELVVNNKTARTLGLKISEAFLMNADEVID